MYEDFILMATRFGRVMRISREDLLGVIHPFEPTSEP